jgi:hypothetical protein
MTFDALPLRYQWEGDFKTEGQLIVNQYQNAVRQSRRRNRIRHVIESGTVTAFADDFEQAENMDEFLRSTPGRIFKLASGDTKLWRCIQYSKALQGAKGETSFTLQIMQVYKP